MLINTPHPGYRITLVTWQQAKLALTEIRRQVFIQEQAVPEILEWDELDDSAIHFLATDAEQYPIG